MTRAVRAEVRHTDDVAPESGPAPASFGDYLGPAEVVAACGPSLEVEMPGPGGGHPHTPGGRRLPATIALALPYAPVVGDLLLVIGRGDACYVIGVLRGQGRTSLTFHGDVELGSLDGKVIVTGQRGVELRGPEVDVHAGKLRMVADAVVQRFTSVCQRVTELLSVHAGQSHTLVDEGSFAQAKRSVLQTEETVTINGKEIHLG